MNQYKLRIWPAFLLVLLLCWLDYQFFTEGLQAHMMSPIKRGLMHLVILASITAVGYWGWNIHPMQWIKKVWLFAYVVVILVVAGIRGLQAAYGIFGPDFLDGIFGLRIFFCSPAPFFILYLLARIAGRISATGK